MPLSIQQNVRNQFANLMSQILHKLHKINKNYNFCRYLSPVGPKGTLQGRKEQAGKDEQFTLVDSHPQVTLFSKTKERYVSGKQGLFCVS